MVRLFGRKKTNEAPRSRRALVWYWTRRTLGLVLGSLLVMVALLVFALFLGPTRGLVLSAGVKVADSFLPGTLTVDRADWPRLGHLVFQDLLWVGESADSEPDTLIDLSRLDLGLDVAALRAREGRVDSLVIEVRNFDLPALTAAFTTEDAAEPDTQEARPPSDVPYLNPGSFAGLPSATVGRLQVGVTRMRLAPDLTLSDLDLVAWGGIAAGTQPWVEVDQLAGQAHGVVRDSIGEREWSADLRSLTLAASLDSASIGRMDFRRVTATLDSLSMVTGPVTLGDDLAVDTVQLKLRAGMEEGRKARLVLGPVSARGHIGAGDSARSWDLELAHLGLGGAYDPDSVTKDDLTGLTAALDSLNLIAGPLVLEDVLAVDEVALELQAEVKEGRKVALVLGPVSAHGHKGARDSTRAWNLELDHLGLGGSFDPETVSEGDFTHVTAALDSLNLVAGPALLGPGLQVMDIRMGARGQVVDGSRASVTIGHMGARMVGDVADSAGTRHYGLALEHLGMGARLLAEPDSPSGWRLLEVNLDSLDLDLGPSGTVDQAEGWVPEEPLMLETRGILARDGAGYSADLVIDFALPGTSHFPALLPPDFPHEAFGALAGELKVVGDYQDDRVVGDLVLDIAETPWLDAGHVDLHLDADHRRLAEGDLHGVVFHADSLALGLYGASLFLDGGLDEGDLDLQLELAVEDPELVRMFTGFATEEDSLTVDADLRLTGTLDQPGVDGFVEGMVELPSYHVPRFRLDLDGDDRRVDADLVAGGGIEVPGTVLDSVAVSVNGVRDTTGGLTAGFSLQAWQDGVYLGLGGFTALDTVRTVRLDSLRLSREKRAMALMEPATLTLGPEEGRFTLTPLVIEGDAGEISLQGHWAPEDFALHGVVDLDAEEEALKLLAPSPLWSMNGGMDLALDVEIELDGTQESPNFQGHSRARLIPHRDLPSFGADLDFALATGDTAGLYATMKLMSADTVLVTGSALWPGRADLTAGIWQPDRTRELEILIPLQTLPLVWANRLLPKEVGIKGPLNLGADVGLKMAAEGKDSTDGQDAGGGSRVAVNVQSPGLEVSLPNRSRIEFDLDLVTSGTLADPLVKGRVKIGSAFFRIPEIPRSLHPVEGPSMLWALKDSIAARLDSTVSLADSFDVFVRPVQGGPALEASGPAFLPDLDIDIVMPGNIRINGYGADIELEGDVHVGRGFDEDGFPGPALGGSIRIRRGTIQFMNRVFKPERGNIEFTGDTPPNPHLDLILEADVSGTIIRILVTGRANDPQIDLTSEPDMQPEDIMAVLLFGQPLNDLDNDQRGGMDDGGDPAKELRDNLAGLAMAFGTQGISNQMTTAIGVDMMQMGSDSSGGSTFMVGKFISPEIMVKYHASLEHSGTYFMTLEYTLSRYFKVVTTYGQGEEASGAELQWSRKY